jgi:pyruvate/2-oxoglutarate dehydrogenase complex dihydrolipoamide acyltransferase (E2) component
MAERIKLSNPITIAADLWATNILPEGTIERWLCADGSFVEAGDPVVVVRIEDTLHNVTAPCKGRLRVGCRTNAIIEPGTTVGHISRDV